jgi:hypothetical protein
MQSHELFEVVRHELAWLVLEWKVFKQTFSDETRDLLDKTAPGFFSVVNLALQCQVCMALARLTDPASSGTFNNISLAAVLAALPSEADADRSLARTLDDLQRRTGPLRQFRSKHVAHRDLEHGLGRKSLPGLSRQEVDGIIEDAARLAQAIATLISPDRVPVPLKSYHPGGAPRLMRLLRVALANDPDSGFSLE